MVEIKKNEGSRFIKDIIGYAPSKLIPAFIAFLWSYIFTRIFPPDEYGIYSLATAIVIPLITVIIEWAGQPIGRFYAEFVEKNRAELYFTVVKKLVKIVTIIAGSIGLLSIIVSYFFFNKFILVILGLAIYLLFNSLTLLLSPILPSSMEVKTYRRLEVFRNMFRLGIAIFMILSLGEHIVFLIWADAIAAVVFLFPLYKKINLLLTTGLLSEKNSEIEISKVLSRFTSYGLPMMLWFLFSQLLNVGDRFVIQYYYDSYEVGVYSANYQLISGFSSILSAPITLAAFPIIYKLWANEESKIEKIRETMQNMTYVFSILAIGVIGGTYLVSKPFVTIALGAEYIQGYKILPPVVLGLVLMNVSTLGHKGLELFEQTKKMALYMGVSSVANLVLNILFVPEFGYEAAAWTTLISYIIYCLLIWAATKKYIEWKISWGKIFALSVIAVIAVFISKLIIIENTYIYIIVTGITFVIIYFAGVLLFQKLISKKNVKQYR